MRFSRLDSSDTVSMPSIGHVAAGRAKASTTRKISPG